MITLPYSLVIEATEEPDFFGFYSPDLEGFSGIGHSVEDCLYKARWGMADHMQVLREQGLSGRPERNNVAFELYTDVALTRDMPELGLRRGDVVKLSRWRGGLLNRSI